MQTNEISGNTTTDTESETPVERDESAEDTVEMIPDNQESDEAPEVILESKRACQICRKEAAGSLYRHVVLAHLEEKPFR